MLDKSIENNIFWWITFCANSSDHWRRGSGGVGEIDKINDKLCIKCSYTSNDVRNTQRIRYI
jgi:hypothetical protein